MSLCGLSNRSKEKLHQEERRMEIDFFSHWRERSVPENEVLYLCGCRTIDSCGRCGWFRCCVNAWAIWTLSTLPFRDVKPLWPSKCKGTAFNRKGTHLIGQYLGMGKNEEWVSFHIQHKKDRRDHKIIAIKFLADLGKWAL